jgi:hypothetical protein
MKQYSAGKDSGAEGVRTSKSGHFVAWWRHAVTAAGVAGVEHPAMLGTCNAPTV